MKPFALGRMKVGQMNRTESEYAAHLQLLKKCGEIAEFWFEGMKLKLAENTFYTPDFVVLRSDGYMEMHEVKGFWRDDARVKIKVAADKFPFKFIAVRRKTSREGGGWEVEKF